MASDKKETSLATNGTTTIGSFLPADFEALIGDGFASIDTVMIGAPDDGKLPFYIGRLVGPGESISMNEGESEQKTWAFHPVTRTKDGKLGIAENVTHIVPASYMVHAACARIFKECERRGVSATVGLMFMGKGKTRKGRALNQYRVFERYEPLVK
jgi:hypothetical protein